VTFSAAIDGLLGGGIATGTLTELCGPPGIGKTQMCMQLSVDGTIPAAYGGCEGHVIYIDTEGSFAIERLKQMATSAVKHVQSLAGESDDQSMKER
jgi:RAD51-like protein 2